MTGARACAAALSALIDVGLVIVICVAFINDNDPEFYRYSVLLGLTLLLEISGDVYRLRGKR